MLMLMLILILIYVYSPSGLADGFERQQLPSAFEPFVWPGPRFSFT